MATKNIDEVVIIYNPNSTGDSTKNAEQLRDELKKQGYKNKVTLIQTKYPRHAEKIAATYAKKQQKTLLVSSSGDGGYHELINGILASSPNNIVAGLLPSGNANDHFSAIGTDNVVDDIIASKARHIDVIKVEATIDGSPWVRYAHSYVGVGISPVIGKELNKLTLNAFNEKVILLRELFSFGYVTIKIDDQKKRITSLIFANIDTMSKVLTVSKEHSVTDGKFEVSMIEAGTKPQIIAKIFWASTVGLKEAQSTDHFTFDTIHAMPIQLDGEVYTIDANAKVTVSSVQNKLSIII